MLLVAIFGVFYAAQFSWKPFNYAKRESFWVNSECKELALDLRDHYAEESPLIAVTAAGCLPYWTRFEALDLLGLNDLVLPSRPPELPLNHWNVQPYYTNIGHRLGNWDYVLERKPDIIVFHVGWKPSFAYALEVPQLFPELYCETLHILPGVGWPQIVYLRRDFAYQMHGDAVCGATPITVNRK